MEKPEEEADLENMVKISALDMLKMRFLFHIHVEMLNLQLNVYSWVCMQGHYLEGGSVHVINICHFL